jgi:hypothetical protein
MSEGRTQSKEQMERLLKLQTKLRELTEAKKANWRRQGFSPQQAASLPPRPHDAASASATSAPPPASSAPASPGTPAASSARAGSTAPATDGQPPATEAPATEAELAVATDAELAVATEALRTGAVVVLSVAAMKVRQVAGQAWADARGALARSRTPKRRPRPGDPITAEDLIDDRGVGARLLGAAVYVVGLAVIGVVILVQFGKVDLPQLDSGDLPAATSGRVAPSGRAAPSGEAAPSEGTEARLEGKEGPSGSAEDGFKPPDEAAPATGSLDGPTGAAVEEAAKGAFVGPALGGLTDVEEAFSPEVREFAKLQGDLAFRIGEYEITRSEFGRGKAECKALSAGFERVDRAHLVISRVVARWREPPERQSQAYSELSTLLDDVRRHYEASGCAPFDSPLP